MKTYQKLKDFFFKKEDKIQLNFIHRYQGKELNLTMSFESCEFTIDNNNHTFIFKGQMPNLSDKIKIFNEQFKK